MNTNVPILGQKNQLDLIKAQLALQVKGSTELKTAMVEASITASEPLRKALASGAYSFYQELINAGFTESRAFTLVQDWFLTVSLPSPATNDNSDSKK